MKKNSIAKNYIYNLIYQLLTIFLPLITTPYLSRVLGAEQIGIYGYTTSFLAYFILFGSLGIAMYGQREIAYYQDNKDKKSKTFWELIIIRSITLIISTILFYLIFVRGENYSFYYRILLIHLTAGAFDISWFFQGIEEFDKTVVRNLIVKLLCLILIFTVVKTHDDLWKYFLIYASAEFIGNVSIWVYVPKYINKVSIKELQFKKHLKPTISLFLPQIAIQIYTVLDKSMIGLITNNMEEVGFYEQAQKIVKASLMVVGALQTVMNSRIANGYARNDKKVIHDCLEKSFKFVWFFTIPLMLGIISLAYKFVPWYYGDGFDDVIGIMIVISPILIAIGLNGITGVQYLVQIGKHREFTKSVVIGSIINAILNVILIRKYGALGAAVASVAAEFGIFIYQLKYFSKDFTLFKILKLSINNLVGAIVMFIVLMIITSYLPVGIIYTLIEVIIGIIVYICILFILKDKFLNDLFNQAYMFIKNKVRGI